MSALLPYIWSVGIAICVLADCHLGGRRARSAAALGMSVAAIGGFLGAPAVVQIVLFICALRWLVFWPLGRVHSARSGNASGRILGEP